MTEDVNDPGVSMSYKLLNPDFDADCPTCMKLETELMDRVEADADNFKEFGRHLELDLSPVYHSMHYKMEDGTPAVRGVHYDKGKPPLSLLSRVALEDTAEVMGFGAEKYSAHNWRNGISWTSIMGSALRHLYAFNDGEDMDEESGLSHLAHAMCDVMFLLEYTHTDESEFDDRWIRVRNENVQG